MFVAIFSAVTQFDVCPAGWYNCRLGFLGRTTTLGCLANRADGQPIPGGTS